MTGAVFSYALLGALATALLVASVTDLRARHIDNRLNGAIALAAPLWWIAIGLSPWQMGIQMALAAVTFAVACVLFVMRQMGGGDVKLLGALALWFAPPAFAQVIILMAVVGGGASLAMASFNLSGGRDQPVRDGMARVATMAWVLCLAALASAIALNRPLIAPWFAEAVADAAPGLWTAVVLAGTILALMIMAVRHVFRRQKSRPEVPYGIAIAAAALWVMGSQMLVTIRFAAAAI